MCTNLVDMADAEQRIQQWANTRQWLSLANSLYSEHLQILLEPSLYRIPQLCYSLDSPAEY